MRAITKKRMSMFNNFVKNQKKEEKQEADNFIEMYKKLCNRQGYHIGAKLVYSEAGIIPEPIVMKTKKEDKLPETPEQKNV